MLSVKLLSKSFVYNSSGKILALRRSPDSHNRPSQWDLPGGKVDQDEDPVEAAKREALEESGLEITDLKILEVVTTNSDSYVVRLIFSALTTGENVILSEEHTEYRWVTPEEFLLLEIAEPYKTALRKSISR